MPTTDTPPEGQPTIDELLELIQSQHSPLLDFNKRRIKQAVSEAIAKELDDLAASLPEEPEEDARAGMPDRAFDDGYAAGLTEAIKDCRRHIVGRAGELREGK